MARGNERRDIVRDDGDRRRFQNFLGESVMKFGWILFAYVLMSNHFHLLLELTEANTFSRGMHWLNGRYARWFNRQKERVGHLFQGRFKGHLVEKETYLLEVLRYIVLNPVRAGMVRRPEEYAWSSHRAVLGQARTPPWLAVDDVLINFGRDREFARLDYRQFVDAGIGRTFRPWDQLVGQIYLGSPSWAEKVREKVELEPRSREYPRAQRLIGRPSIAQVIDSVAEALKIDRERILKPRGGVPRMLTAWIGSREGLLTNSEIAAGLRIRSSGHVSDLIQGMNEELAASEAMRQQLDRCLATLRRTKGEPKT